jgi:hypothetical protein
MQCKLQWRRNMGVDGHSCLVVCRSPSRTKVSQDLDVSNHSLPGANEPLPLPFLSCGKLQQTSSNDVISRSAVREPLNLPINYTTSGLISAEPSDKASCRFQIISSHLNSNQKNVSDQVVHWAICLTWPAIKESGPGTLLPPRTTHQSIDL